MEQRPGRHLQPEGDSHRQRRGDRNVVSKALHDVALVHAELGRQDSVLHYYARALEVERAGGLRAAEAVTLANIGRTYHRRGRADSAFVYLRRALALRREIGDRRLAIETAIRELQPGDVLLIAGKGHEDYQIIGTTKHHFSDHEVALETLKGL